MCKNKCMPKSKLKNLFVGVLIAAAIFGFVVFMWLIFPKPESIWNKIYGTRFEQAEQLANSLAKETTLYQGIECGGFIANENCTIVIMYTTNLSSEDFKNLVTTSNLTSTSKTFPSRIDGYSFITELDINAGLDLAVNGKTDLLEIRQSIKGPTAFEFRELLYRNKVTYIAFYETQSINLQISGRNYNANIVKISIGL